MDSMIYEVWDQAAAGVRQRLGRLLENAPELRADLRAPLTPAEAQALAPAEIAPFIDHTLLKPEATRAQVEQLCNEALTHRFAAVCVNPDHVTLCVARLCGSGVGVATVIGFPLGACTIETKAGEARQAAELGATELDMVVNLGRLKDGDYERVRRDIEGVVAAGLPVKVILETGGLTLEEKIAGCLLARAAGAAFVKTSTGFLFSGATEQDISLMRRVVGPAMGVKASGGVRDTEAARAMVAAGATRLGTSSALAIIGAGAQAGSY